MAEKIKKIPAKGFEGEVALREAAAGEFRTIIEMVRKALTAYIKPGVADAYIYMPSIFADKVIAQSNGRLYSYPYSIDDNNQVQIGAGVEVVLDYAPVTTRMAEAMDKHAKSDAPSVFLEAKDDKGLKWRIKVVEAGLSGNRNFYPDAVLREALPLFNGTRVFVKSDEEHLKGKGKSFNQLIGQLSNAKFVEGKSKDTGEVHADLSLLASAGEVPVKLREAFDRGMGGMFGFSMDASGNARREKGKQIATKITRVASVDLIIEPGAGGSIINFIEAKASSTAPEGDADMKLRNKMIDKIKSANKGVLPTGLDVDNDDALEVAYREALADDTAGKNDNDNKGATGVTAEEMEERMRMVEAKSYMRETVAASKLPDAAKEKLREQFGAMANFKEAQVDEAIKAEGEYLAKFTESGKVNGMGEGRTEYGEDRADKVNTMLDNFFRPKAGERLMSFKECYVDITGDSRVTGMLRDTDNARFRESLSDAGNLDVLLGDSIHRAMIADYREIGQYDVFRPLISTVPLADFRTNHRTRLGGYGDLPTVAKMANYLALTSPADEEATYAPSKKGGLETIGLEDIRNDDVGLIRRIPLQFSRVAKRTLSKFVLDFIRTNPVIYDTTNLFTVGHGNLGSAALSATSLAARRLAMVQQTELGSGEQIGIGPKFLMGPAALEQQMYDLFARDTNNDETFIQKLALTILPVWYWTDANDWALAADPMDIPGIEIGFLDGQEEPEIFVQDSPTNGSMFNNDSLTWKIRHIYGGAVVDFRAFDKSVVV